MSLLTKATPVLVVDSIEPVLPFWRKVGLTPTTEVPDGSGRLAFVILAAAGVEIMYQTATSVKDDLVQAASVQGAREGYRSARTELGGALPAHGVDAVLAAYRSEGRRLVDTARAVDLIGRALRGEVFSPRLRAE